MKPATKLKISSKSLGIALLLTLASGIQLEVTSGRDTWAVWLHIALGIIVTVLSFYHIYLHYRRTNWFARFARNPRTVTRILWWTFLLTLLTGLATTAVWVDGFRHTPLGGVHGKIGYLMFIFAIIHLISHHRHTLKRR